MALHKDCLQSETHDEGKIRILCKRNVVDKDIAKRLVNIEESFAIDIRKYL